MEEKDIKEYAERLFKKEQENKNDATFKDCVDDIKQVISLIGEESFKTIVGLDFQNRDLVLRTLGFLAED